MESRTRGGFMITGALIGLVGFAIPGLYGVTYSPPATGPFAHLDVSKLKGFSGTGSVSTHNGGVFGGFSGPLDVHLALGFLLSTLAIGLLGLAWDVEHASAVVSRVHHVAGFGSVVGTVVGLIWAFRYDRTPTAITDLFVKDLGGGQAAIAASQHLQGSLGLGALILLFGLLVAHVGVAPRVGGAILGLSVLAFVVLLVVA